MQQTALRRRFYPVNGRLGAIERILISQKVAVSYRMWAFSTPVSRHPDQVAGVTQRASRAPYPMRILYRAARNSRTRSMSVEVASASYDGNELSANRC